MSKITGQANKAATLPVPSITGSDEQPAFGFNRYTRKGKALIATEKLRRKQFARMDAGELIKLTPEEFGKKWATEHFDEARKNTPKRKNLLPWTSDSQKEWVHAQLAALALPGETKSTVMRAVTVAIKTWNEFCYKQTGFKS